MQMSMKQNELKEIGRAVGLSALGVAGCIYDVGHLLYAEPGALVDNIITRGETLFGKISDTRNEIEEIVEVRVEKLESQVEAELERVQVETAAARATVRNDMHKAGQTVLTKVSADVNTVNEKLGEQIDQPLPHYDTLTVAEIEPQLATMTTAQLNALISYEATHADRVTLLRAVNKQLAAA